MREPTKKRCVMPAGKRKAGGDCFENCGKYLMNNPMSDMTLVHCNVTGTGDKVKGVKYSHAFLISDNGNYAFDMTHSQTEPTVLKLEDFRMLGNIENELHYSREEALAEMTRTGHYGAWDDSLITEADIIPKRGPKGKRWS